MTGAFDKVFRFNNPPGLKGHRCRIAAPTPVRRDHQGRAVINDGAVYVLVEFEDGTLGQYPRDALYAVDSKAGRQIAARIARGGARPARR